MQLINGAQAKAYYGLVVNYEALQALVETLLEREMMGGPEVAALLEKHNVKKFPDPWVQGFYWDDDGFLAWPGMEQSYVRPRGRELEGEIGKRSAAGWQEGMGVCEKCASVSGGDFTVFVSVSDCVFVSVHVRWNVGMCLRACVLLVTVTVCASRRLHQCICWESSGDCGDYEGLDIR